MKYSAQINDKVYEIEVNHVSELDIKIEDGEVDNSLSLCLEVVQEEYRHVVERASKFDNKVYILLTVCAFIFSSLVTLILESSNLKCVDETLPKINRWANLYYPCFVNITLILFSLTLIALTGLLASIKMYRFQEKNVFEKNLVSLPKEQVTKYICVKYIQATEQNNKKLQHRYIIMNLCVIFLIITVFLTLFLSYISNYLIYN